MNVIWSRLCYGFAIAVITLLAGCASNSGERGEMPTLSEQTDVQKRAAIRMQLAVGYYEGRQWAVALDEIKQALNIYPDYADAYGMRALIYMEMGESQRAEENFNRALSLAPKNPELANNYGWFLCKEGREAQAMPYFETAFSDRTYRSPAKALNNAGLCSLKLKDTKSAEKFFGRAFQFDPSNPVTNGNLAKIYYDRQDYERARFYIDRVVKADIMTADVLWLAVKIAHKRGDRDAEETYAKQLQRRHPNSPEYAAYQRGAFDE